MDVVVAIVVFVLAAVAGWNIGDNLTVSLVCGGAAALVLLAWGVFEWIRLGRQKAVQTPKVERPNPNETVSYTRTLKDWLSYNYIGSLSYKFPVRATIQDDEGIKAAVKKNKGTITFTAESGPDCIQFLSEGTVVAKVQGNDADIILRWLEKGRACYVAVKEYVEGKSLELIVGLYQDRTEGQDNRRQTVHPLTAYKNATSQKALGYANDEDEVLYDSSDARNGVVPITSDGTVLGLLPASVAKEFAEKEPFGVFLESVELTEDGKYYVPTVRIYW